MQAGVDEFCGMGSAMRLVGFTAFHGDGRTKFTEGHGLHARGSNEIDHGAGKQRSEMEEAGIKLVDTTVVWIESGVIVHVDTGEKILFAQGVDDLLHHFVLGCVADTPVIKSRAGPASVVIRLTVEMSLALARGVYVAEKNRQRAW